MALVLVLFAIIGWIALGLFFERAPHYQGKPISYWMQEASDDEWNIIKSTEFAILGFANDTNAVPFLIEALKQRDRPGHGAYLEFWRRLPYDWRWRLPRPVSTRGLRCVAAYRLGELGAAAKPAIPALIHTLKQDPDMPVRCNAAEALGNLGKGDGCVVSALLAASSDKAPEVRYSAARALESVGAPPRDIVAAWLRLLKEPVTNLDSRARTQVTNALLRLDPVAAAEAGINTNSPSPYQLELW